MAIEIMMLICVFQCVQFYKDEKTKAGYVALCRNDCAGECTKADCMLLFYDFNWALLKELFVRIYELSTDQCCYLDSHSKVIVNRNANSVIADVSWFTKNGKNLKQITMDYQNLIHILKLYDDKKDSIPATPQQQQRRQEQSTVDDRRQLTVIVVAKCKTCDMENYWCCICSNCFDCYCLFCKSISGKTCCDLHFNNKNFEKELIPAFFLKTEETPRRPAQLSLREILEMPLQNEEKYDNLNDVYFFKKTILDRPENCQFFQLDAKHIHVTHNRVEKAIHVAHPFFNKKFFLSFKAYDFHKLKILEQDKWILDETKIKFLMIRSPPNNDLLIFYPNIFIFVQMCNLGNFVECALNAL